MTLEALEFGWRSAVGIAVGGLAYFVLGGLWYMKLFSKCWTAATGRTAEEMKDGPPKGGMLLTFAGCVLATAVLAVVYGWGGGDTLLDGIAIGALLGVGVAAMERMKTAVFNFDERARPWALYAIDAAYAVCGLTLAGTIYAVIA